MCVPRAGGGMDDETGGLVQHQQVLSSNKILSGISSGWASAGLASGQ